MLNQLENDDTDVFNKNLIDRHQHRQRELHSMCLAEFAATFVTNYRHAMMITTVMPCHLQKVKLCLKQFN